MTNKHPNATVGGSSGAGLGALVAWLTTNVFHWHLSAEEGALIAGVISAVALFIGRNGIKGAWRKIVNGPAVLLCVCVAVLVFVPASAAKKPVHAAAAVAGLTASYRDGRISVAGCGYDISLDGGVKLVYTHPDASIETWWVGLVNDGTNVCLDSNYILASATGEWSVTATQGVQQASATVPVPG